MVSFLGKAYCPFKCLGNHNMLWPWYRDTSSTRAAYHVCVNPSSGIYLNYFFLGEDFVIVQRMKRMLSFLSKKGGRRFYIRQPPFFLINYYLIPTTLSSIHVIVQEAVVAE